MGIGLMMTESDVLKTKVKTPKPAVEIHELYCGLMKRAGDQAYISNMHLDGDNLLCQLLSHLGFDDVVDEWEKLPKWYA